MDPVSREAKEDTQITDCPNKIARASLHKAGRRRWPSQRGRHDAASAACVKSKIPRFPREIRTLRGRTSRLLHFAVLIIFVAVSRPVRGQSGPSSGAEHEREE